MSRQLPDYIAYYAYARWYLCLIVDDWISVTYNKDQTEKPFASIAFQRQRFSQLNTTAKESPQGTDRRVTPTPYKKTKTKEKETQ
jgi:hypothetical protein